MAQMLGSHGRTPVRPSSGLPSRRPQSLASSSPASARSYRPVPNKHRHTDDSGSPRSASSAGSHLRAVTPTLPPRPGTSHGMHPCTPDSLRPFSAPRSSSKGSHRGSSDANDDDTRHLSPSDQSPSDQDEEHQDLHQRHSSLPRDDDHDVSSVIASDGAEIGDESPMTAKSPTKQSTSRRVTFIEAPAPQGSAQAAAKFNRQRQRSQVSTTLRRADRLTPRPTWTQPMSPQATPRDTAALEETRARAFPSLVDALETVELDPTVKETVKSKADSQVTLEKHMQTVEESSDPHMQVLPKHMKSLFSIYNPDDELNAESHGGLVQALAGGTMFEQDRNLADSELQRIKTGEDAIAFFATHGDSTDVKVMYARRAEVGICEFRPYDLVLVSEKERGSEFFMISAKGVVHVCPGRLSEHTTLSDWMHQTMIFSVLTSMTFFRHYIATKSFCNWRASARHLAYSALRTRLSRRLFLGKPIFVEAQARIHSLLYNVGATRLISLDATGRALELQPFLTHQKDLCAMSDFEAKVDAVTEVVDTVLDVITNAGRAEQDADRKPKKLKGRSVAAERKEAQLRVHRRRLQEFNVSLLGNFVRVVDVMLLSRLVDLVVSQAADLLDRLDKTAKIFSVSINFREGKENMEFSPDHQGFVQGLTEVLDQSVQLVGSVAPLATSRKYDEHFRQQDVNPARASDVIQKNYKFQATKQAIMGRVGFDFAKAQKEADEYYGPNRKIYDYGHAWDQESFDARQLSHTELADEMSLMRQYEEELEKLKSVHVSGFLLIQARTLRDTLAPVVDAGLQMMKSRLRALARENCRLAYEQFDHVNRDLQLRPQRLEQFAEYVRSYRWTQSRWRELDESKNAVEEMYSMIRQYGIRVEMNEEVTKEALNQKVVMLEITTWPEATAFVEELLKPRTDEVMQRIGAIETEAVSMKAEFKTGIFADIQIVDEPMKVIEKLEQMEDKLGDLAQNGAWLNNCLELFLQPPVRMRALEDTADEHAQQMELWEIALQWNRATTTWLAYHPQGLEIYPIRGKLEGFAKALADMSKLLQEDKIVAELQARVQSWQAMLPALTHLANPSLGSDHWPKIFEPMHIIAAPTEVTIKALKGAGLFDIENPTFYENLSAISAGASAEAGLLSLVEAVVQDWDQQEIALTCAASDIDLWILADQADVLDFLESDLTSLHVVLSSPHLTESIETHAKEWQKRLERAKETLQLWLNIQEQYVLFVTFLEDGVQWDHRSTAALTPVQDYFRPADRLWRQLMSRARTNFKTVMAVTSQNALPAQLAKLGEDLDFAESRLADFLEVQRRTCPRLYLMEDRRLLAAFAAAARHGMASATKSYAEHLFPLSTGLRLLHQSGNEESLVSQPAVVVMELMSPEGEALTLKADPVQPALLSEWLQALSVNCQNTLKDAAQVAIQSAADMGPADIVRRWLGHQSDCESMSGEAPFPGQVMLLVLAVHWSHFVENALPGSSKDDDYDAARATKDALKAYWSNAQQISELLRWDPPGQCLAKPVHRAVIGAALLQALRGHHVLDILATSRNHPPLSTSFEWQRYLRMQWDVESKRALAKLLDWSLDYGYEYVGASPRLVMTPETERNYVGLIGGLRSQAAVAIAGPSGAGKAETVREFARFIATTLVEVNLGASVESTLAASVFRGLASLGAWCIFHMNFVNEAVSVLAFFAQTLSAVSEARRAGLSMIEFENHLVDINHQRPPEVFIVLRGGSSSQPPVDFAHLPVAFRALVRPLAMAVPSLTAVAESLLLVEGFASESKKLGNKIVCFLDALAVQPSSASCMAGASIHAVRRVSQLAGQRLRLQQSWMEPPSAAVLEALEASRCTTRGPAANDPAWEVLLEDLFQDTSQLVPLEKREKVVGYRIQSHLAEYGVVTSSEKPANSQVLSELTLKALDVHRQVCQRQAVVVTGGALSGKSAVLSAIGAAGVADEPDDFEEPEPMRLVRFFPAALSRSEWSGSSDGMRQGSLAPGLLQSFLQSFSARSPLKLLSLEEPSPAAPDVQHLVVLDAELDAAWADELTSALASDEIETVSTRRKICCGGKVWVPVPPSVSFAFETRGLAGASPAFCARTTICSIAGIVQLSNLVDNFGEQLKASGRLTDQRAHQLLLWLRRFLDAGVLSVLRTALRTQLCTREAIDQMEVEYVSRMLDFMWAMLCDGPQGHVASNEVSAELMELTVIYAIAWGLGGGLDEAGRLELGAFLVQALEAQDGLATGFTLLRPLIQSPENLWKFQIVVDKAGVRCLPITDLLLGLSPLKNAPELVATPETEAVRIVCQQLALSSCGFFLCGPRLGGKSSAAQRILQHGTELGWQSMLFRCPLGASGSAFSSFFRSKLQHQPVMSLGPSSGGHCTTIIDDVHLASGTLPERLREMADLGGFNDSKSHTFYSVHRVQCGAIGLSPILRSARAADIEGAHVRWLRHFHPIQLQEPGVDSLKHIFTLLLQTWTSQLTEEAQECVGIAIQSLVFLLPMLNHELPMHPNRLFHACHLSDVFQFCRGLCQGMPNSEISLNRLVFHEASRQFRDRLRHNADREAFTKILVQLSITIPNGPEPIFANVGDGDGGFNSYSDLGGPEDARDAISDVMEATLRKFHLPIVLFADLVISIVAVARSLQLLSAGRTGLILILGPACCGKRVCGLLGAHLACWQVSKPNALDGWGLCTELSATMTRLSSKTSTTADPYSEHRPLVFGPVVDAQLDTACGGHQFLRDLDSVVRGAHVPLQDAPGEADAGMDAPMLHHAVILCLSPERCSASVREMVRTYPGLVACAGVTWIHPWSRSTHEEIAQAILLPGERNYSSELEENLAKQASINLARAAAELPEVLPMAVARHCHSRQHAQGVEGENAESYSRVSPARFLASLTLVRERQAARQQELVQEKTQLESALGVLMGSQEVASSLADRYESISQQITQEELMVEQAEILIEAMKPELLEARRMAEEHEQLLLKFRNEATAHKDNIDDLYEEALHHLLAAQRQLQGLSKASILECRLVDVPAEQLAMAIWPVLTALGRPAEWQEVESLLSEKDAVQKIIAIDPKNLTADQVAQMDEVYAWELWGQGLDDDSIPGVAFGRCCVNLVPSWLDAAHKWEEILPQRHAWEQHCRKAEDFERAVTTVRSDLAAFEQRMQDKEQKMKDHQRALDAAKEELVKLTPEAQGHQQLVEVTHDEARQYRRRRQELKDSVLSELPGNLLLGAFLVHYTGALAKDEQDHLLNQWRGICEDNDVRIDLKASVEDLLKNIGDAEDEVHVADTLASVLSSRSISMCLRSLMPPLIYDPFGLVSSWLLQACERKKETLLMQLRTNQSPTFLEGSLKTAAKKHLPVFLEVTDGCIPVVIEQLLHADNQVPLGNHGYSRVFLVSRHVMRSAKSVVAFMSFDLKAESLQYRLLDDILKVVMPELRTKMAESRLMHAKASAEVARTQTQILDQCSATANNNVADPTAGAVKDNMDVLLFEVQRLKGCKEDAEGQCRAAAAEIARAQSLVAKWKRVAEVGVALYVALLDAEKWHCMYHCSWDRFQRWFFQFFKDAISSDNHPIHGGTRESRALALTEAASTGFLEVMAPEFLPLHRPMFAFCVAVRLAGVKRGLDHAVVAHLLDIVCAADEAELRKLQLPAARGDEFEDFSDCEDCPRTIRAEAWQRLRACAVVCPVFKRIQRHIHSYPSLWEWVERANASDGSSYQAFARTSTYKGEGASVPKIELPHVKHHLSDVDDLHEVFMTISLVRRLALPVIRRFIKTELGQESARAVSEDRAPREQFETAVRGMGAPRVLVALSERQSGIDARVDLENWLTGLANEEGFPLSVLSGVADGFLEKAEREAAKRQQYHGWILILDVMDCQQLAQLWELTGSIIDEHIGDAEDAHSFLLALSVHIPSEMSANCPLLPPSLLSCASRLAVAPPCGLKGRLAALFTDRDITIGGNESDERSWPSQRAGLIWLYVSLTTRAALGPTGWSLPYTWTLTDLSHALGILKLVDDDRDLRYGDAANIASFLGLGVHFSSHTDRLAFEVLTQECVRPQGLVEVWENVMDGHSLDSLPARAGMEELVAFTQAALFADDGSGYSSYLPSSCGLGLTAAEISMSVQDQEAGKLLKLLHCSFWEELRPVEGRLASSEKQQDVELLGQIQALQSSLAESIDRLVAFTKVKRRLSSTRNIRGKSMQPSTSQVGEPPAEETRFPQTVRRELHRLSRQLTFVLESLAQATDVLKGRAQSNERVRSVIDSIWQDEVPAAWDVAGQGLECVGLSLATWAQEMNGRSMFLADWGNGRDPISFWLGGLACPRDLLTAILQRHSQNASVCLDELSLGTRVTAYEAPAEPWCMDDKWRATAPAASGVVYVHGFALTGACWGRTQYEYVSGVCAGISDSPQVELPSWITLLQLVPQLSDLQPMTAPMYRCPVYRRKCRGASPLLEVDLPSCEPVQDAGQWAAKMALRGVALVCAAHSVQLGDSDNEEDNEERQSGEPR